MSTAHVPAELRRAVRDRARGVCEYCLIPEVAAFGCHQIDHIIAEKHGGATTADNLALSCTVCNLRKGPDVASIDAATGDVVPLFHPRRDRWPDHFRLTGGMIEPLSPVGRVTARLLGFNAPDRVAERELLRAAGVIAVPGE